MVWSEPCYLLPYNDNQNTDPENDLRGSKNATAEQKDECNPNKETIKKSLLTLRQLFIGNDW